MTQENPPSGEKPKKNMLKLLFRAKPAAEVETSAGRVYLYPLRVRDMTDFGKLEPGDAVSQIRAFLSSIGSLTLESDEAPERVPLDAAIAADLPNDEIERIADSYAQSSAWQTIREGSQTRKPSVREAGETASAFLVRLLKAEVEDYHQSATQMHERLDLLKNLLFTQVKQAQFTQLKDEWKKITKPLEKEKEKPLRFLRYFLMANYVIKNDRGDVVVREDEIYDWFVDKDNAALCDYAGRPFEFVRKVIRNVEHSCVEPVSA
jgi:hypothetical protein